LYLTATDDMNFIEAISESLNFRVTGTPVSTPDTGSTVMLVGLGFMAIAVYRKKTTA
jgi:hypothetical protein